MVESTDGASQLALPGGIPLSSATEEEVASIIEQAMADGKIDVTPVSGANGGIQQKKSPPPPAAIVLDQDGTEYEASDYWAKTMKDASIHEVRTINNAYVSVYKPDPGGFRYKKSTWKAKGGINDCVFRAIDTARRKLGLGEFDTGDKVFFESHPRVDSAGVQRSSVLGVTHGLLAPWGLGISRVYVPKGTSLGDELVEFRNLLGCNPIGITSGMTSNAEFAKTLVEAGMPQKEIDDLIEQYKFEYIDKPHLPAVVMYSSTPKAALSTPQIVQGAGPSDIGFAGYKPTTTSAVTYVGGHADFRGPRDYIPDGWKIAFKIGRIGIEVTYPTDGLEKYVEVEPEEPSLELDIWQSLFDGKTAAQRNSTVGWGQGGNYPPPPPRMPTGSGSWVVRNGEWTNLDDPRQGHDKKKTGTALALGSQQKTWEKMTGGSPTSHGGKQTLSSVQTRRDTGYYKKQRAKTIRDFLETIGIRDQNIIDKMALDGSNVIPNACPICLDDVVLGHSGLESCLGCEWDTERYASSKFWECRTHRIRMMYDTERDEPNDVAYFCPSCMMTKEDRSIGRFLRAGGEKEEDMDPVVTVERK